MKEMDPNEFVELGYLQEVNRQYLHPIGLALAVAPTGNFGRGILYLLDARDDPEGIIFSDGFTDEEIKRADDLALDRLHRASARIKALGYNVQPTTNPETRQEKP